MIDTEMKKALMDDVNRMVEKHGMGEVDWLLPVEKYEGELKRIALTTNEVIRSGPGGYDPDADPTIPSDREKTSLKIVGSAKTDEAIKEGAIDISEK